MGVGTWAFVGTQISTWPKNRAVGTISCKQQPIKQRLIKPRRRSEPHCRNSALICTMSRAFISTLSFRRRINARTTVRHTLCHTFFMALQLWGQVLRGVMPRITSMLEKTALVWPISSRPLRQLVSCFIIPLQFMIIPNLHWYCMKTLVLNATSYPQYKAAALGLLLIRYTFGCHP